MTATRVVSLTCLAMIAFAGNSLLCRLALRQTRIDAASFTTIRIISGAAVLSVMAAVRYLNSRRSRAGMTISGSWASALALFAYAAAFSFAYVSLSAGTGALLLFGAVQMTMILWGVYKGERLRPRQLFGFVCALAGLVALLLPGISAPPLSASVLMLIAGCAWGVYSLRGKGAADPVGATTGNFLRAVPLTAALSVALLARIQIDRAGFEYAVLSGAIASGLGYVIWYAALPGLNAASAASVQLSVPVFAAAGGILLLGESLTLRLLLSSVAVLGGIAMIVTAPRRPTGNATNP